MRSRLPLDTFEKRNRPASDVYTYKDPSSRLRQQVVYAVTDVFGPCIPPRVGQRGSWGYRFWEEAHERAVRELGRVSLSRASRTTRYDDDFILFLKADPGTVHWLTVVEILARMVDLEMRLEWQPQRAQRLDPDEFVETLNTRFREHAFGYAYESGRILKVSSDYLHQEAVRPAIELLGAAGFEGALDEFLRAHQRYREGAFEAAVQEALKSNESVIKSILEARGWTHDPKAPFRKLLQTLYDKGFFGGEMLDYYQGGLDKVLSAGLPTLRNQPGAAHGSGVGRRVVPEHVCTLALHHAAANAVFLIRRHRHTAL